MKWIVPIVAVLLLQPARAQVTSLPSETPPEFVPVTESSDYTKRDAMIPLMEVADIFRGCYGESPQKARAVAPNKPLLYSFALPTPNHVFLPGRAGGLP
jgi:hypothetical protein